MLHTKPAFGRIGIRLLAAVWIASGLSCDVASSGGGGTDVPDSFQAQVTSNGGGVASGARVRIRPERWRFVDGAPEGFWETSTDASGTFHLTLPQSGRWSLEILDSSLHEGRFLSTTSDSLRFLGGSTVRLAPFSSIRGIVPPPGADSGIIVLEGTDLWTRPDSAGAWSFDHLGPGSYHAVWIPVPGADSSLGTIEATPGDTAFVPPPGIGSGLVVAGRLVPATGWDSTPQTVEGWIVVDSATGTTVTTDAWGKYQLRGVAAGPLHLVATDPVTGISVVWDTVATAALRRIDLPERIGVGGADASKYVILQVANSDRIRHRLRVRAMPDTAALRATGSGDAARAALPAMTGWTDDSGRFALQADAADAYHVTLIDSASDLGAVFPWGAASSGSPAPVIRIGSPVSGSVTIRYPDGVPTTEWLQGHLVSVMGTSRVSLPVLPGNSATIPSLYPGEYRLAVVSYETARSIPGTLELRVVEGVAPVVDTLLTQDQVEDTTAWSHATLLEIDAGSLPEVVRHLPVRIDLDDVLASDSTAIGLSGYDLRFFDESGRWIPGTLTRFDRAARVARAWIQLDSLFPGSTRRILVRHGNPIGGRCGFCTTSKVFSPATGILATYRGGTRDETGNRHAAEAFATTNGPGFENAFALSMDTDGALRTSHPTSELGSAFGIQAVVRLDGSAPDSERILSLRDPSSAVPFASIGTRSGKPVLHASATDSVIRQESLGTVDLPRGTWLAVQVRRLADTISISIRDGEGVELSRLATPISWPNIADSLAVSVGSPVDGLTGLRGALDALDIMDGSWSEGRATFDALQRTSTASPFRATPLR